MARGARWSGLVLVAAGCVAALSLLVACSRSERAPSTEEASPGWIEVVRGAHDEADRLGARPAGAEGARVAARLEAAFRAVPEGPAPELVSVRQDLAGRIARLELDRGNPSGATEWATRGLELSPARTVFRAQLLLVRADAEKSLGHVRATHDALVEALGINQDLLDRELEHP